MNNRSVPALLALSLFGQPAAGWEVSRDLNNSEFFSAADVVEVTNGSESNLRIGRPVGVPGAASVSLRISIDRGQLAYVYIYDRSGVLRERILANDLPAGNQEFWSDFISGDAAALGIEAVPGSTVHARVTGLAVEGAVGELNAVHGDPEFEPVDVIAEEAFSAVLPLLAYIAVDPNTRELGGRVPDYSETCSGILISPALLLTAAHCLFYDPDVCLGTVALFGLTHARDVIPTVRRCTEVLYLGHSIDTMLLRLDGTGPSGPFPFLPIEAPDSGAELWIIQHPRGTLARVARDSACRVASSVTRLWPQSAKANVVAAREAGFSHYCDTLGGSSGAPLLSPDGGTLLGIQHAGSESEGLNYAIRSDVIRSCIGYQGPGIFDTPSEDPMCR